MLALAALELTAVLHTSKRLIHAIKIVGTAHLFYLAVGDGRACALAVCQARSKAHVQPGVCEVVGECGVAFARRVARGLVRSEVLVQEQASEAMSGHGLRCIASRG